MGNKLDFQELIVEEPTFPHDFSAKSSARQQIKLFSNGVDPHFAALLYTAQAFFSLDSQLSEIEEAVKRIMDRTITELAYISNDIKDGSYLLNLQIAPFENDASPSRPILFKVRRAV